jgi:hypothetical protein
MASRQRSRGGSPSRRRSPSLGYTDFLHEHVRERRLDYAALSREGAPRLGCPDLRREAYMAERLYQQMDDQGRTFLNSPKALRVDRQAGKIYLPRYFDWYREDFVGAAGPIGAYLAPWLTPDRRETLEDLAPEIEFLDYDWSLNDR